MALDSIGENMKEVKKEIKSLADLQRVVYEMELKGMELDRVEGTDAKGYYAVFRERD